MFSGQRFYIQQAGSVSKQQIRLLSAALSKAGAIVIDKIVNDQTPIDYFIADSKFSQFDCLKFSSSNNLTADSPVLAGCQFISVDWPVACLKAHQVLPFNEFKLRSLESVSESKSAEPDEPTSKRRRSAAVVVEEADVDSSATASTSLASESASQSLRLPPRVGAWICAQSSLSTPAVSEVACPANADIVRILGQMADTYGSTNDKWRVYSYKKAAQAVKRCSKPIDSRASAQSLPGVGSRLADKIWEIAQSGRLAKLDCLSSDETVAALKLFTSLWGAGPVTAQAWVAQGLRSLDDLASRPDLLNRQQKIGLKHYDDFLNRMPRSEAGEIESVVAEAVHQLGNGFIVQACGSYRRGRPDCGDVDVLVTHPDGRSHAGLLTRLVTHLERTGFLTDHLVSCEENGDHKKYLGVCRLPLSTNNSGQSERRARRLDIIVVPYNEYACSLVYFTGSEHFCRSLRHLAKRLGMSLNEHALYEGVIRRGAVKVNPGRPVNTPDEASVFQHLGVPYRPPNERDH
ncbi:hypothetical protein BOX15_Mlig013423g1 [Macrostomum lignano]|uniref:Uncharacterized protein n=2 Tax=Macrostomum lignano TaxID=282301 RepID=A0A267GYV1_9PLAT|nr:hypothetical protein BOX15_Mlig013423g1 [Macrostomum lignano]